MAAITATPQVEADKRLVQFRTYEDYLTSLVILNDHCYLQSTSVGRTIAELGYRSSGETLTREQFEKRLAAVIEYLYPTFKPYVLASENLDIQDPFLKEMALRECSNRMGILAEWPTRGKAYLNAIYYRS
ncbi:flagella-associated protein [Holotrichia oblita]|uniref:Flagella-associated protein n=1 Tax=Holotrichia oblita TaxID=644536 RepID=A0ACB9T5Z0_HOLOL|nr:flagella-associated protein [Holotrichia oblita]